MSFLRLAIRGLAYYGKINATVALSVAAATSVLVGALLVGDSVRGSLRGLTLDSLGRVDQLLLTNRYFRASLVDDLKQTRVFQDRNELAAGLLLFPQGTVERAGNRPVDRPVDRLGERPVDRASNVLIIGCRSAAPAENSSFWDFGELDSRPPRLPAHGEIVLNEPLAQELRASIGDSVTVRLPSSNEIPADSPMGEKEDRISSLPRLRVIDIIPAQGLGSFRLSPSQSVSRNAFLSLEQLQEAVDQTDRINAILVAGRDTKNVPGPAESAALSAALNLSLADYGLSIDHPRLVFEESQDSRLSLPQSSENTVTFAERTATIGADTGTNTPPNQPSVVFDYFRLTSDQMILDPEVEAAAVAAFQDCGGQPVFTYLANRIQRLTPADQPAGPIIPYSMVTAIDLSPEFAIQSNDGERIEQLLDDQIVLTSWASEDLNAKLGDTVTVTFFEPETTHGKSVERTVKLSVKAITPLVAPAEPYMPKRRAIFDRWPTLANDPHMTPEVKGLTDQRSINNWDVPFDIDFDRIRSQDDSYWADYGTTPKAYVSLATGRRLWGSRFGKSTSFRIPTQSKLDESAIAQRLKQQLQDDGVTFGFQFRPIKQQQLAASSGNTPFDLLFFLLSFFIIAAALMLVAILFRLGFQQRAAQAGLLLAVGWPERRVRRLFVIEGACVAAIGGLIGVAVGIGYARLILAALGSESWWLGAVATPFLEFHFTWQSLLIGYFSGVLISTATIVWSVFQTRQIPVCMLLAGLIEASFGTVAPPSRIARISSRLLFIAAIGLAFSATSLGGQAQAGAFVGAGAALLTAMLLAMWNSMRSRRRGNATITGRLPLIHLAARSATRNPSRSTLTIGLIAFASFLIVAMSAFQLKPSDSGTGGFDLLAESSQPIFNDLGDNADREALWGDQAKEFQTSLICSFRVQPGDDASCGNLYQTNQPRILGVSDTFISHFDDPQAVPFPWSSSAAQDQAERENPWRLLGAPAPSPGETPPGLTPTESEKSSAQHLAQNDHPIDPNRPIPVVIDKETAMYSLHLYKGIGEEFSFTYGGQVIKFRVAGLLSISILHGSLLIGEADFRRAFPTVSGHRYFLIQAPRGKQAQLSSLLESTLGDQGFDATDCRQVLAGLQAIQNTYLHTFQSLGALGLLLGTFGLGAVQLRSVLERRREMALFRAIGFRSRRLVRMVVIESLMLLLAGLGTGVTAATFAVLPHAIHGDANLPIAELGTMLGVILLVGIVTGTVAASAVSRTPVLSALREQQ